MPNPLSVMTSSPSETFKSNGPRSEPGDEGGAAFEAVLNQHKGENKDESAELNSAEPDLDVETDETVLVEELEKPADPEKELLRPSLGGRFELGTKLDRVETPSQTVVPEVHVPKVHQSELTGPNAEVEHADAGIKDSSRATTIIQNRADLRPEALPEAAPTKAVAANSALRFAGTPSKEVTDLPLHLAPTRHETQQPPLSNPAAQRTTNPARMPSIAQLQLFAPEKPRAQVDATAFLEVEDNHVLRTDSPVSAGRDAALPVQLMAQTARAETARAIAGQISAAINAQPKSGAVEITLNPEELGRVSIMLNGRDDGLNLTISAERPETLEMMRRHLSVLEEEFRNFGLGDLSFGLGTSSDTEQHEANHQERTSADTTQLSETASNASPIPKTGPVGRIDMRL